MGKLIEKYFPIGQISQIAERESWRKEVYRPVYYIHKWWARRLGTIFRGIILGASLDEKEDFFSKFYDKNNFNNLTILDPFAGSGVTLGEALKLGCRVIGRDINPVAATIIKSSLLKYSTIEIEEAYSKIEKSVKPNIEKYFKTKTENGELLDVLYYFHVKYLNCPNCKEEIELFNNRIFSKNAVPKKDQSARSLCPNCNKINEIIYNDTSVKCNHCNCTYNPQKGAINGAIIICPNCNYKFKLVEFMSKTNIPLNTKPFAKMVLTPNGEKYYDVINEYDKNLIQEVSKKVINIKDKFPDATIEPGNNTNQVIKHNYNSWVQFFSDRQLFSIWNFIEAIKEIENDNIRQLFACLFSGVLEFNNLFCSFKGEGTGAVRHIFSHHILKPEIMPIEANIWGTDKSSGSFYSLYKSRIVNAIKYKNNPYELKIENNESYKVDNINNPIQTEIAKTFKEFKDNNLPAYISQGDSSSFDLPDNSVDLIITDPPFFDNVHYSELADFFYYWLNQILNISTDKSTRNKAEVQDTDSTLFAKKLTSVFDECNRVLKNNGLFIFTYHHSRHEGWVAVHEAIRHAGFVCIQSYPIKSEMSVSMPLQQAKTPIHVDLIIVCKKYSMTNITIDENNIISNALETASSQVNELSHYIDISLGDAKVALMGRLLCELSLLGDLDRELKFLKESENKIDNLLEIIISNKISITYSESINSGQLTLFEKAAEYLIDENKQKNIISA